MFSDNSPVFPQQLRSLLHELLLAAGLIADKYTFHGLRAGRACDMVNMGITVETGKKLGHWKSNAVFAYLCD